MKNTDYENKSIIKQLDYSDSCRHPNQQNSMDYQIVQIKTEPQESEYCSQQFYEETNQNFKLNNAENVSQIDPYERPNSEQSQNNEAYVSNPMTSPNIKQCIKCGFICNSITMCNIIHDHRYAILLDDEIIKTEVEVVDLNLFEVFIKEENITQHQPNHIMHQLNENDNINHPILYLKVEKEEINGNSIDPLDSKPTIDMPISSKLKAKHVGKKEPFSCSLCGKVFTAKRNLNQHKARHSKAKPYKCKQSPKQITQKLIHYTKEEKIEIIDWYLNGNSMRKVRDLFAVKYPNRTIPSIATIHNIVVKFNLKGFVDTSHTRRKKPSVMTEENKLNILLFVEENPSTSLAQISNQFGISKTTIYNTLKEFKYKSYTYFES